jgi:hypothetical protein
LAVLHFLTNLQTLLKLRSRPRSWKVHVKQSVEGEVRPRSKDVSIGKSDCLGLITVQAIQNTYYS